MGERVVRITGESGPPRGNKIYKKLSVSAEVKIPEILCCILILLLLLAVIIMYCFYNNFCGKHWAVIGPEMSGPHGSPDY
jgi:hypothetical protein